MAASQAATEGMPVAALKDARSTWDESENRDDPLMVGGLGVAARTSVKIGGQRAGRGSTVYKKAPKP